MNTNLISAAADPASQQYIALLEKTNQQLSLWSNPYGVLVAVLSFLVAFLAVGAVVILNRQSREQKDLFMKAIEEYKTALDEQVEQIKKYGESKIQEVIVKYQTELTKLQEASKTVKAANGNKIAEIEKKIQELTDEKSLISQRVTLPSLGNIQAQPLTISGLGSASSMSISPNYILRSSTSCLGCKSFVSPSQAYCGNCGRKQ